ncbi:hypothetical protein ABBQ32_005316 [Trebouxia sp. C0010 RCD-2024]
MLVQLDRRHWVQLAGSSLDPASYTLARQDLRGSPVVLFKRGFLAQQEELGLPSEPIEWQHMGSGAASGSTHVADMEFCTIERVSYHTNSPELQGQGKRKHSDCGGPFLRVLLARHTAHVGACKLGLWLEHHVCLGVPEFIIGRERFEGSLARPLLPQQRVKMVWRDAADPSKGDWYTGMVVQEAEEWAPLAGSIWEGVSVMWDTDLSITHVSPWELHPLLPQQHPHTVQQQQEQQQQQQLSGANLHAALLAGDTPAGQRLQADAGRSMLQFPLFQTRQDPPGQQGMPRVAEHPMHLPKLHLRGPAAQGGLGPKKASRASLAEPGSGVSAATPDALPWRQAPSQRQDQILGPGWALAQQYILRKQQSLGGQPHFREQASLGQEPILRVQQALGVQQSLVGQQLSRKQASLGQEPFPGMQQSLGEQQPLGEQQSLGGQQSPRGPQLLSLQRFMQQQQQSSPGGMRSLGGQNSLGEQQLQSLQDLIEQQQQQGSLGLEQSQGWRDFLAQHQSVGLQQLPQWPNRGLSKQQFTGNQETGVAGQQAEEPHGSKFIGVRAVPGVDGATVYAAFLVDDKKAERTLEVFPTAEQAARAHDVAALRQYGLPAQTMLNHPLESYSEVLSELQSYRRTGSTEDLDSPMSNPDSPGWVMNMRSQSLAALGIAPASPHTQRQLLASGKRQTPTSMLGAKRLPQHASSSRLAALAEHVSNAEMDMAQSAAEEDAQGGGSASRKGGKHTAQPPHAGRNGGKRRLSRSPIDRLAAPVGRSRLTNHDSQATGSGAHSAPDSKTSHQSASSTSAMVSSGEEGAEEGDSVLKDKMPCPIGTENPRVNLRGQSNRRRLAGTQEEWGKTANAPSNEEEWTESPVTRSSRSVKLKAGLRQSSASSNPRVVAARKAATVGSRRRSEKLSNFSGVTLKNGRIAVMLWNPNTKKPIHLGYWPSSLAAGRIADKARLSADFRRNDADLNFPKGDYSLEELPATIAQLAEFIREEQSAARAAEPAPKPPPDSSNSRQPRTGATSARSALHHITHITPFM